MIDASTLFFSTTDFHSIHLSGTGELMPWNHGYPDLISYDFIQTDIYLHTIWIKKDINRVHEAEFIISSIAVADDTYYGSKSSKGRHEL